MSNQYNSTVHLDWYRILLNADELHRRQSNFRFNKTYYSHFIRSFEN